MKTNFFKSILTFAIAAMVMVACERDERLAQGSDEEEEQTMESASVGEDLSDDALEVVGQIETQLANAGGRVAATCPTVTKDKEHKTITLTSAVAAGVLPEEGEAGRI